MIIITIIIMDDERKREIEDFCMSLIINISKELFVYELFVYDCTKDISFFR